MSLTEAIKHLLAPQDPHHSAVSKRVADAERDLNSAAADNAKVTKLLEKTLEQNAHH